MQIGLKLCILYQWYIFGAVSFFFLTDSSYNLYQFQLSFKFTLQIYTWNNFSQNKMFWVKSSTYQLYISKNSKVFIKEPNLRCKLTAWDGLYHDFWDKYVNRRRVEEPDIVIGIHPGLHAEGVYEYWEPTLELLLDKEIVTVFTVLNEEEFQMSLERLDALFCRYLHKGKNPFASHHVKQTPHDADLMWASNMYLIIFKVRTIKSI